MSRALVRWQAFAAAMFAGAMLVSCASAPAPPEPVSVRVAVTALPDVNPDANGRASPVVLRLYQLKTDAAFNGADFFALFDNDKQALGADLLSREEVQLAPGERRTLALAVSSDAAFLGAMAAYRDIRNSSWRALIAAPGVSKKNLLTLNIERSRVTLTIEN